MASSTGTTGGPGRCWSATPTWNPGELTARWGAIDSTRRNEQPEIASLERLRDHFRHSAWLKPMPERAWVAPSVGIVARVFPMYPLTVAGVARLAKDLSTG